MSVGLRARIISETPVTIIEEDPEQDADTIRKKVVYLRRIQGPPSTSLREEWSLEPHGESGSWGYDFKYESGELHLFQKDKDGDVETAVLSSNDWGILKHVTPQNLATSEAPVRKRQRKTIKVAAIRPAFRAVWLAKTSAAGRWHYRASYKAAGYFVLDLFSAECGVFRTLLVIPMAAWDEKMLQISENIDNLFRGCRNWSELLVSKKAPSM